MMNQNRHWRIVRENRAEREELGKREDRRHKHLTLEDRLQIEDGLRGGLPFKEIAEQIGKSPSTVSREVQLHAQPYKNGFVRREGFCSELCKPPYVCNGCVRKGRNSCPFMRRVYIARKAQEEYRETLVESRSGVALNRQSFYDTERILTESVKKGQSVYHAVKANDLPVSCPTVYRYINQGYYRSIKRLDLPRAVTFKPRARHPEDHIPKWAMNGREYADYQDYRASYAELPVTQLDTVIGRIGGKTILTIHFVPSDFMIGRLLNNKTAVEAAKAIQDLKARMKARGYDFGKLFHILLTDNGGEFSCVSAFENDAGGKPESRLFFCEPRSPEEKPEIEKNHTLLRSILPKGTSFDDLTQEDVDLVFSHMNSVLRKQFNGKSAYDMFTFAYSDDLASVLGISRIPPTEVIQSPKLLKKKA